MTSIHVAVAVYYLVGQQCYLISILDLDIRRVQSTSIKPAGVVLKACRLLEFSICGPHTATAAAWCLGALECLIHTT